jgi:hypothetical protein
MENIFLSNKVFASITLFVILIMLGCNKTTATRDFSSEFRSKIDSIEKYVPVSVANSDFNTLGMYLYEITNHSPTVEEKIVHFQIADEKDSIMYSRSNFDKDKKVWLKWLRKTKSKYTLEYSDSIYNRLHEIFKSKPPRVIYDY